jgi:predicted RNA-binding protein with PUA domain
MAKRYCEMCDVWIRLRECPACGATTVPAVKETPKVVNLMDALRKSLDVLKAKDNPS